MSDYSKQEFKENLLEGYFLEPAIPEVKDYTSDIIRDILSKYPVDGIHLDFIRYPYSGYNAYFKKYLSDFGYNPLVRKVFKKKYGFDPIRINRFKDSHSKRIFDKFRCDQITDIVKRINKIVKLKDKNLVLSAAVMPRYDIGKKVYFQDWPLWLKNSYIDIACVMSYTASKKGFSEYIKYAGETENNDKIFMGIRVKKNTGLKKAYEQINLSYENGMRGYVMFSFEHDGDFIEELNGLIDYNRYIYKY